MSRHASGQAGLLDDVWRLKRELDASRAALQQRDAALAVERDAHIDAVVAGRLSLREVWSSGIAVKVIRPDGTLDVEVLEQEVLAAVRGVV